MSQFERGYEAKDRVIIGSTRMVNSVLCHVTVVLQGVS